MTHVCLIRIDNPDRVYILTDKEGTVVGYKSPDDGLDAWTTDTYGKAIARGHVGAMSACVHALQCQPAIVSFDSVAELRKILAWDTKGGISIYSAWGEAGGFTGLPCLPEAVALWEQGQRPALTYG